MRVIYLDMVFLINTGMDLLLLFLTGKVWGRKGSPGRLLFGAVLGGFWACLVTVQKGVFAGALPEWLTEAVTAVAVSFLMLKAAYPIPKGAGVKYLITLYGLTFFVGGSVDLLYYHSFLGAYLRGRLYGNAPGPVSLTVLVAGAFLAAAGCILVLRYFLPRWREPDIRDVRLTFRGRSVRLKGLYDTGNRLTDPYFGKPVHVLELDACEGLLSEAEISYLAGMKEGEIGEAETALCVLPIPFCSVGESHGILPAVFMEELELEGETPLRLERPLIGLAFHRLSGERAYQMILHPAAGAGRTRRTGGRRKHDFKSFDAGTVSVENDAGSAQSDTLPPGGCALYRGQ